MSQNAQHIIAKRHYPVWIKAPIDTKGNSLDLYMGTYPIVAKYLANRLAKTNKDNQAKVILELCCGVGTSSLFLSKHCKTLIGVDNNPEVLSCFKHNLALAKNDADFTINDYEAIQGDIHDAQFLATLNADLVLYDIPYWSDHGKNLTNKNPDLSKLITTMRNHITKEVVIYAPPHMLYEQIKDQLGTCEFQQVFINDKHDRNIIYLGTLVRYEGITTLKLEH